jgi:hypothetical protein
MIQQYHSHVDTQRNVSQVAISCTPMFIAALFTIAKLWKQPRCPMTDEWIKEVWYLYTMKFFSAIKKNEIFFFF